MLEGVGLGLEVLLKGLFYFQIEDFKKLLAIKRRPK